MVRPGNAIQTFQPILPYRQLGSPFIRLTGDEFCSTAESSLYLLENINSAIGGTALTNTSATFSLDNNYGNTVAVLNGSTQYLSLPTEASVEVGSGSFLMSVWFNTSTIATMYIISYGSQVAGKAYWSVNINSSKLLNFLASDGTNTAQIVDPIAGRWQDGLWHNLEVLIDRTSNTCYLIVDGIICNSGSIATLGSLTQTGEKLYLGAVKGSGGSVSSFLTGSLANFHLIKAADYNAIGVLNQGIRKSVCNNTPSLTNYTTQRFSNRLITSGAQSAYNTCLVNVEAGEYELQLYAQGLTDHGISYVSIDNVTQITQDQYTASDIPVGPTKAYKIPLTEGQHILEFGNNGSKNGSSSNYYVDFSFINLIKRRGHEEGGTDNLLLFGDEITEKIKQTGTFRFIVNTSAYYINEFDEGGSGTPGNGDYFEGTLFIKGGLYRIDFNYGKGPDAAQIDLWFGNVQVFSQLDTYAAGGSSNNTTSVYVRLNQGRQDIRMASNGKNGSSTGYNIYFQSLKAVRLSD